MPQAKRCQICCADLSKERAYMQQKLLCPDHLKATSVLLNGSLLRFCFQHGKLEPLDSFDGLRRTCRAKLRQRRAKASDAFDMPLLHADLASSCHWQLQLAAAQFPAEPAHTLMMGSCSAPANLMSSLAATPFAAPAMLPHQQLQHESIAFMAAAPAPAPATLRATSLLSQGPSGVSDDEFEAMLVQLLAQEVAQGPDGGSAAADDRSSLAATPDAAAAPSTAGHGLVMRSNSCSSMCMGAAGAAGATPPMAMALPQGKALPPAELAGSPTSCSGTWPMPAPTAAAVLAAPDVYTTLGSAGFAPPAHMAAGSGPVASAHQAAAKLAHLQQQLQLAHASLAALQTELRALSAA